MGVHGRLFRNVASNLGNEILDNFEAEVQRDYIATKKLAADETKVFNGQLNNLDAAYENFGQMKNYMVNNPNLFPLNVPGEDREMAVDKTLSLLFIIHLDKILHSSSFIKFLKILYFFIFYFKVKVFIIFYHISSKIFF